MDEPEIEEGSLTTILHGFAAKLATTAHAVRAICRLISGAVDVPTAWLESQAKRIRVDEEARSKVIADPDIGFYKLLAQGIVDDTYAPLLKWGDFRPKRDLKPVKRVAIVELVLATPDRLEVRCELWASAANFGHRVIHQQPNRKPVSVTVPHAVVARYP